MANLQEYNTPDVIKNLPEFYGEYNELNNFLRSVDLATGLIANVNVNIRNFWGLSIRNKIKGKANERLKLYGDPTDWDTIKNILKRHFTDSRNNRTLYNELNSLKQDRSIKEFYDNILSIITALNNIASEERNQELRIIIIERNMEEGNSTFINGIREPYQTILKSRNPNSIEEAYNIALELQMEYNKPTNGSVYSKNKVYQKSFNSPKPFMNYRNNNANYHNYPNNNYANPVNRNNNFVNPINRNNNIAFQPNAGNNSRQYRQNIVEPMDVDRSTQLRRFPNQNRYNFQNRPNQPQRFVAEELFTQEGNFQAKPPNTRPR